MQFLFVKGKHCIRANKVADSFIPLLDLKGASLDEGWSQDRVGNPRFTIITNRHNRVAVNTQTLKECTRGKI